MSPALLAAALARASAAADLRAIGRPKPYGVLVLAYDVDVAWRRELAGLRAQITGRPVESVDSATDATSIQRAIDRLAAQNVGRIVAVPIETVSASPRLERTRYWFGERAEPPAADLPDAPRADVADRPLRAPRPSRRSALAPLGPGGGLRLRSPVPLTLAPALDRSPVLIAILADRAKTLARDPAHESLVLAGVGPRSDDALKAWAAAAGAIAAQVGAKAGLRAAFAVAVRDGVRADQQDRDRAELKSVFRGLIRRGRVVVVPLSPEADRVRELLERSLGSFYAYRWDGKGVQGDRRLADWIAASAEQAAQSPAGRRKTVGAPGAPGGITR